MIKKDNKGENMTEQKFEKAKNIKNRLTELDNLKLWCKSRTMSIYINPTESLCDHNVKASDKMKECILGVCEKEIETLKKEFEDL